MAVDPYKAYQMCIAMGNPPAECAKRYNSAKKTAVKPQKPQKKDVYIP